MRTATRRQESSERLVQHYRALLAFFRHRLSAGLQPQAEDLAQETVLAGLLAFRHDRVAPDGVEAYLLGIARHKLQDAIRARGRARTVTLAATTERIELETVRHRMRDLEDDRFDRLARALVLLPEIERLILDFRFRCGLSNSETARRLRIPPATASRLKYRAIAKLRWHLLKKRTEKRGSVAD